jgi:hypothetical protein
MVVGPGCGLRLIVGGWAAAATLENGEASRCSPSRTLLAPPANSRTAAADATKRPRRLFQWVGTAPRAIRACSRGSCSGSCRCARKNLDRHPNYILAAYMASGT